MQNYELFTVKCFIHDALNECDIFMECFILAHRTFLRSICSLAVFTRTTLRSFVGHTRRSFTSYICVRHVCLFTLMYHVYCVLCTCLQRTGADILPILFLLTLNQKLQKEVFADLGYTDAVSFVEVYVLHWLNMLRICLLLYSFIVL